MNDVQIENHGNVFLFRVLTDQAKRWVEQYVQLESWQWLGNGFSVDHRYASDLCEGMKADGLIVEFC